MQHQQKLLGLFSGMALFLAFLYLYPLTPAQERALPQTATASEEKPSQSEVVFTVLGSGTDAPGAKSRKNYAIYSQEELNSFWTIAYGSDATAPNVDFSTNYVIAVFGGRMEKERSISVRKIEDVGTARNVAVTIAEMCGKQETSPFQFIVVPNGTEYSLSHTDETKAASC